MGPTWLRQVSPLLHKTTLTTAWITPDKDESPQRRTFDIGNLDFLTVLTTLPLASPITNSAKTLNDFLNDFFRTETDKLLFSREHLTAASCLLVADYFFSSCDDIMIFRSYYNSEV